MPVVRTEYPKMIDGVIYKTEQDHIESEQKDEIDQMVKELKDAGHAVDLRNFRGDGKYISLKLYHESKLGDKSNGDSSKAD